MRVYTAAEKRDFRKQKKERVEKMEVQKQAKPGAEQNIEMQKEKMKFMVPSSDEAMAGSLTDEEEAEAEGYAKGVGGRFDETAGIFASARRDGFITYTDQDQVMEGMLVKETSPCYNTRSSPRKPQSLKAKVGNSSLDMDMGNENGESLPHVGKPQRPTVKVGNSAVDTEDEKESPPHVRKPRRAKAKRGEKSTTEIEPDEDDEKSPRRRSSPRLSNAQRAKAIVFEEDMQDDAEKGASPNRTRPSPRLLKPKGTAAKTRVVEIEDKGDELEESPPRNRLSRGRPPKASKAKVRLDVDEDDEEEDMDDVVMKSPPRTRGQHRAVAAKRPKGKFGDAPRIDPCDEPALYTFYAGLNLNAPNKTTDKARLGKGMGHKKK